MDLNFGFNLSRFRNILFPWLRLALMVRSIPGLEGRANKIESTSFTRFQTSLCLPNHERHEQVLAWIAGRCSMCAEGSKGFGRDPLASECDAYGRRAENAARPMLSYLG
jgi:hypothetical protein